MARMNMRKFTGDVTIDETLWTHHEVEGARINWTKHESQVWVVGLVEIESGEAKCYIVEDRKTETLQRIIAMACDEGTCVHHDGWAPYNSVDYASMGMTHRENLERDLYGRLHRSYRI